MKSLKSINFSFSISPMTRWIVTMVILVALLVIVVVLYTQQQTRNSDLKDDLEASQTSLINNSLQRDLKEVALVQANLSLSEMMAQFASPSQSMDIQEALYMVADVAGVSVLDISCSTPSSATVGSRTYEVYNLTVETQGDIESQLRFVTIVGDWLPSAGMSKSASMSITESGEMDLKLGVQVYALAG